MASFEESFGVGILELSSPQYSAVASDLCRGTAGLGHYFLGGLECIAVEVSWWWCDILAVVRVLTCRGHRQGAKGDVQTSVS